MCLVVFARMASSTMIGDADVGAHADQTPIDVRGDDAARERGNQSRLRRGKRMLSRVRRADEIRRLD